jgi:hypothetical protein
VEHGVLEGAAVAPVVERWAAAAALDPALVLRALADVQRQLEPGS